jgi:hypothetical protein
MGARWSAQHDPADSLLGRYPHARDRSRREIRVVDGSSSQFYGDFPFVRSQFHARWCSLTAPKKGAFDDTFGSSGRSPGRICNARSRGSDEDRDLQRQRFRRAWATDPSVSGRHDPEGCSSREEEEELGILTPANSSESAVADSDNPSALKAPPRRGFLLHRRQARQRLAESSAHQDQRWPRCGPPCSTARARED